MAQDKAKQLKKLAQKHLHSRISFLYQSATYLAKVADQSRAKHPCVNDQVQDQSEPGEELQRAAASSEVVSDNGLLISPMEQEKRPFKIDSDDKGVSKDFALSRQLVFHIGALCSRSQIRLSAAMKHSICKRCGILLVPGSTSTSYVENKSRGARKAWADVLVTTCTACGTAKRFPVGAKGQLRRESRVGKARTIGKQGHQAVQHEDSG